MTGKLFDEATGAALMRDRAPVLGRLKVDARDAAGPFVFPFPKKPEDQAKLDFIGYRNSLEKLAEKFHHDAGHDRRAQSGGRENRRGRSAGLPNVLPRSRNYEGVEKPEHRQMLSDLNVDAVQPKGDRVVVDKSDQVLRVYAGDRLIAQFPATMGSSKDPLPLGTWTINGTSYLPPFHYQPDLFWDVADSKSDHRLPPGPNGPVRRGPGSICRRSITASMAPGRPKRSGVRKAMAASADQLGCRTAEPDGETRHQSGVQGLSRLRTVRLWVATVTLTMVLTSMFWIGYYHRGSAGPSSPALAVVPPATGATGNALVVPVRGVPASGLSDTFSQARAAGEHIHDAIDIPAPEGTAVLAARQRDARKALRQ